MNKLMHPLRRWREKNGVTLEDLRGQTGLSLAFLSMLERDLKGPSLSTAARLSDLTDIPIEDFVRESA